ncbi:flagellar basal body P-ring biosynthesis protein FlgA [Rubripirellula lacrimiformis]|uniref:Flagellar basal body P-ring biosynthesis protein FlgA n=1 Tax=Rubripirellula lacrimiformis TaxID=1930273 RepID=A0A517NGE8_9BACT|nr:flagellar basal body P-ring formation chaperone FlgA [Rubripirellula lacrimiformis]QDT06200.1 flagellar basal body P-ring biosynthesis protein FlgA [Rubripirellula lacrimiformis]
MFLNLRFVLAAFTMTIATIAIAGVADAQRPNAGSFDVTIDANTRWSFRTVSPVTVTSPIVRLGDVVQPIDPHQSGWQRLSRSAIGLVPVSGRTMTIQRDRLNKAILNAEATPHVIDWHGPTEIQVDYRQPRPGERVQPVGFVTPANSGTSPAPVPTPGQTSDLPNHADDANPNAPPLPLSLVDAKRVIHWFELSMTRFYPDVAETYEVEVPNDQVALVPLQHLTGVTNLESLTPIRDGVCRFKIIARSVGGPIESEIEVRMTSHPKFVVPTRSMGRGQRIGPTDLELKPFPADQVDSQAISDIESLIGKETRNNLRVGQLIDYADVGAPILVHRGDLIEVRVRGGGVTVTTNAKSLADGAESDLIEIETLNPRKRLIARVAQHGVVEIVTRAPVVR